MPALPSNIERSRFRRGEYVGYTAAGLFRIRHDGNGWRAVPGEVTGAKRLNIRYIAGRTLAAVSGKLCDVRELYADEV